MKEGSITREIVRRLKNSDHDAFAHVYNAFYSKISGFAFRLLQNREESAEVTQEVFLKLWKYRHTLDENIAPDALLYTITRNIIFNQNKKRRYEMAYLGFAIEMVRRYHSDTETTVIFRDYETILSKVIEGLPEQRRKVFSMSRYEGLSNKEIASLLSISVRTVEGHIRLALEQIRQGLSSLDL